MRVARWFVAAVVVVLTGCGGVEPPEGEGYAPPGEYHGEAMGSALGAVSEPIRLPQGSTANTTLCPGSTRQYGVDVSYYQGAINWSSVRAAGKNFAYIRYSDGANYKDPNFTTNWRNAKAAGLTVGAYQFFRASQDPTTQADLIVNAVSSLSGLGNPNLPIVIDVETNDGMSDATVISRVNTWLNRVQGRTGRRPALYTSPGYWDSLGDPSVYGNGYLPYLWVAHWGVSCPTVPSPWGRLRFWQYTDTGTVSGISGNVDHDEYNGSLTEMQSL